MTQKDEALQILKDYNAWRRDKGDTENLVMPDPKKIGEAIDVAITVLSEPELPDGWVAVPVELLKDITNCFDNVPSRAHVVNGTDENLKRIAQWVNSSDGGYGLYQAVNHYLQSAPTLNEKG